MTCSHTVAVNTPSAKAGGVLLTTEIQADVNAYRM